MVRGVAVLVVVRVIRRSQSRTHGIFRLRGGLVLVALLAVVAIGMVVGVEGTPVVAMVGVALAMAVRTVVAVALVAVVVAVGAAVDAAADTAAAAAAAHLRHPERPTPLTEPARTPGASREVCRAAPDPRTACARTSVRIPQPQS